MKNIDLSSYRNVVGYEGLYMVNNCGNVYSFISSKILKNVISDNGYHVVNLYIPGISHRKHRVHRLVANAWIDNPYNKPHINHKNFNTIDNRTQNLEWVTSSENHKHRCLHGHNLPPKNFLGKFGADNNKSKKVVIVMTDGKVVEYGSELELKRETGFDNSSISKIKKRIAGDREYTIKRGNLKGCKILFNDI